MLFRNVRSGVCGGAGGGGGGGVLHICCCIDRVRTYNDHLCTFKVIGRHVNMNMAVHVHSSHGTSLVQIKESESER